jgi:hypothetical protein
VTPHTGHCMVRCPTVFDRPRVPKMITGASYERLRRLAEQRKGRTGRQRDAAVSPSVWLTHMEYISA